MAEPWLIYFFACNREMQPFSFFFSYSLWGGGGGGDFGSGSGSKFNCAARLGSGQTISGTGRVRASVLSPCRPLVLTLQFLWSAKHADVILLAKCNESYYKVIRNTQILPEKSTNQIYSISLQINATLEKHSERLTDSKLLNGIIKLLTTHYHT